MTPARTACVARGAAERARLCQRGRHPATDTNEAVQRRVPTAAATPGAAVRLRTSGWAGTCRQGRHGVQASQKSLRAAACTIWLAWWRWWCCCLPARPAFGAGVDDGLLPCDRSSCEPMRQARMCRYCSTLQQGRIDTWCGCQGTLAPTTERPFPPPAPPPAVAPQVLTA